MKIKFTDKNIKKPLILLAIILLIAIPICIVDFLNSARISKTNSCIKKGRVCSPKEIFDGVEVLVSVSPGKEYIFNVISNDENEMTLLLQKNLSKKTDWHEELTNIKGPQTSLLKAISLTESWNKIPKISQYTYSDLGKINFEKACQGEILKEPGYDCSTVRYKTRGYNTIEIARGEVTFYTNMEDTTSSTTKINNVFHYQDLVARARLVEYEELNSLIINNELPKWLVKNLKTNQGFWTLTSSTAVKTDYAQGAHALVNIDGSPSLESLKVTHKSLEKEKIGIRPVIAIPKK